VSTVVEERMGVKKSSMKGDAGAGMKGVPESGTEKKVYYRRAGEMGDADGQKET
jgi:hypothetical protein